MTVKKLIEVCDAADVASAHGTKVEIENIGPLSVFCFEGSYFVVDDKCTHGRGSLSEGEVSGDQVVCPFHKGAFNFRTGMPTARPCTVALKTYPAHMVGTRVCITDP